tara:strand:+ start:2548 stop:3531 length:984 start_codon:yes stop_codon:yes gene_type:complete
MTARLRNDPDALAGLIDRAAQHLDIRAAYVEKDFWVTEVLRVASQNRTVLLPDGSSASVDFIFKGGTSLSRVFGLIERFSEDIDLLAVFPSDAKLPARHKVLKLVDAEVSAHLDIVGKVTPNGSTTGVKRYTTYQYSTEQTDQDLKEGVLLELGSRGGTYPAQVHPYRSMVSDYAISVLNEDDSVWEEFAPFDVNVLSPERTLLEKIAAVHDAASRTDESALAKGGRHFYDIHRLLEAPEVQNALGTLGADGVKALVDDINEHSNDAGFSWTPRPAAGYADSPAFDPSHASRESIATAYKAAHGLIYGTHPTLDDIAEIVQHRRDLL